MDVANRVAAASANVTAAAATFDDSVYVTTATTFFALAVRELSAEASADDALFPLLLLLLLLLLLPLFSLPAARKFARRSSAAARQFARRLCTTVAGPQSLPGPMSFPIIGSLHVMANHGDRPFQKFTEMSHEFGPVYAMTMGSLACVVVNDYPSIKEVLITDGSKFGGRPDFDRYNALFDGDRNNSLALCDWSWLQETRRKIARKYCSPKVCSSNYGLLDSLASDELVAFLESLAEATAGGEQTAPVKQLLMMSCANMFIRFMCSKRFEYDDAEFQVVVRTFDEIFWEINQGYPVDYMPWLRMFPSNRNHLEKLSKWSKHIRNFMMTTVVSERSTYASAVTDADADGDGEDEDQTPRDFTDALLMSLRKEPGLEMSHVLFELEDFIGGHSAVGNLVMLALSLVATNPHVARGVRDEAERVTGGQREVRLYDKPDMPYTEATLFETLRVVSSPIVPHVATEDATIQGRRIAKGTCVIINNYELNTSPKYWDHPEKFDPNRFIQHKPNESPCIRKPEYFLPFSTGKRTCIGQQLVTGFGFVLLAGILQRYEVRATEQLTIPEARMALSPDAHPFLLRPLNRSR